MLCNHCNKNLASVFLTKFVGGELTKIHLCDECAQGISDEAPAILGITPVIGFTEVLASIPQIFAAILEGAEVDEISSSFHEESLSCSSCGSTFDDLRETGRVGCGDCYTSFKERLQPLLVRIHGNPVHKGKIPVRGGSKFAAAAKVRDLRTTLERHIMGEEYEAAALVRDQIRQIEAERGESGHNE